MQLPLLPPPDDRCDRCGKPTHQTCALCSRPLCHRRRCREVHLAMCMQGFRRAPAK
jgi:hypothetical protein